MRNPATIKEEPEGNGKFLAPLAIEFGYLGPKDTRNQAIISECVLDTKHMARLTGAVFLTMFRMTLGDCVAVRRIVQRTSVVWIKGTVMLHSRLKA